MSTKIRNRIHDKRKTGIVGNELDRRASLLVGSQVKNVMGFSLTSMPVQQYCVPK